MFGNGPRLARRETLERADVVDATTSDLVRAFADLKVGFAVADEHCGESFARLQLVVTELRERGVLD